MSSATEIGTRPDAAPRPGPPRAARGAASRVISGIGQTLITVGAVALLLVVYQLWVTNFFTARHQTELLQQVQQRWLESPAAPAGPTTPAPPEPDTSGPNPAVSSAPAVAAAEQGPPPTPVEIGQPFAVLHVPRLGGDWAVVEGVAQTQLSQGPGHYVGTALPGQQGNFSVAGHAIRSVFLGLGALRPNDPIVVETANSWFVYRVLGDPVGRTFTGDPSGIPGQETVLPTAIGVISPTPDAAPDAAPTGAYLTLTTCTPAATATHRLVVHARLDGQPIPKATTPAGPPALQGS